MEKANNTFLNGVYTKSTNAHGKPVYFHSDERYAIWFEGNVDYPDWYIGEKRRFDDGWFSSGYIYSGDAAACPNLSQKWREKYVDGERRDNENLAIYPTPTGKSLIIGSFNNKKSLLLKMC